MKKKYHPSSSRLMTLEATYTPARYKKAALFIIRQFVSLQVVFPSGVNRRLTKNLYPFRVRN